MISATDFQMVQRKISVRTHTLTEREREREMQMRNQMNKPFLIGKSGHTGVFVGLQLFFKFEIISK